jgi:hypothetical protein
MPKLYDCTNGRVVLIHDSKEYLEGILMKSDAPDDVLIQEVQEAISNGVNFVINYKGTAS